MFRCIVCSLGPQDGRTLHRINAKGRPGVFACEEHLLYPRALAPPVAVSTPEGPADDRRT